MSSRSEQKTYHRSDQVKKLSTALGVELIRARLLSKQAEDLRKPNLIRHVGGGSVGRYCSSRSVGAKRKLRYMSWLYLVRSEVREKKGEA